jgi:hypothetical protein
MGEKYYYSWPTKNKDGSKGRVEGGSIKLAMDLARLFGNCQVDCRVQDTGTHLMIYAKFVDIETGFSLTRPFQQRKNQNTGMKDADRQQDIVLQIGASKAIRNVVLNSMPTLAEYGMQEAKKGLKARIEKNPGEAKSAILNLVEELNIDLKRIESFMGNKSDKWTINDLTKIWVELNTIKDGYANVEDIYPIVGQTESTNSINEELKKSVAKKENNIQKSDDLATEDDIPLKDRVNNIIMRISMDKDAIGTDDFEDVANSQELKDIWAEVKKSGDKELLQALSNVMA